MQQAADIRTTISIGVEQAAAAGASGLWLMVTAANTGAQALYAGAGFVEAGRYHYRQAPLRRALGAC